MSGSNIYDRLEPEVYEAIAQRLRSSESILEIGCGDCRLVNLLAQKTGNRVLGIDIAGTEFPEAKEIAKKLGVSHLVNCIKGDAENLSSLFSQKFEATVSMYVLHELEKPAKVLKEAKKVLKGGGEIILVDFLKGSTAEKIWAEDYYTPEEIQSLLEEAEFEKIRIELFGERDLALVSGEAPKNAL